MRTRMPTSPAPGVHAVPATPDLAEGEGGAGGEEGAERDPRLCFEGGGTGTFARRLDADGAVDFFRARATGV